MSDIIVVYQTTEKRYTAIRIRAVKLSKALVTTFIKLLYYGQLLMIMMSREVTIPSHKSNELNNN